MKTSELCDKDSEELTQLETTLREKLVRLRVMKATSKTFNTAEIRTIRRDIARVKTIQTQRVNAQSAATASSAGE